MALRVKRQGAPQPVKDVLGFTAVHLPPLDRLFHRRDDVADGHDPCDIRVFDLNTEGVFNLDEECYGV